jgi:hypothetical protein
VQTTREAFLEAFEAAGAVLRRAEVRASWEHESALKEFSVKGLAGHLVRAGARIEVYLDEEPPTGEPIPAPLYFVAGLRVMDEADNERVRNDGEATSAGGWEALIEEHRRLHEQLKTRLAREPADRLLRVYGGHVMLLDEYLETRIVELLVHADDLAVSVGLPAPQFPEAASDIAIRHLVEVARLHRGDREVLIALSRRERDKSDALRVF